MQQFVTNSESQVSFGLNYVPILEPEVLNIYLLGTITIERRIHATTASINFTSYWNFGI